MKKTLTLLIASTALTAAIGVPAWSAMTTPRDTFSPAISAELEDAQETLPLVFVSDDDDDDDEDHEYRNGSRYDDDDDDDDDDDCDDEDEDEDEECNGSARNPAPAGTVAPPQNGLFGTGAPPQVQVN
jgi:ABC-type Zn2+ transport system substrate-binding protein/surface adhesin